MSEVVVKSEGIDSTSRKLVRKLKYKNSKAKKKTRIKRKAINKKLKKVNEKSENDEEGNEDASNTRNFVEDLKTYLVNWQNRNSEGSSWKFNKIIQTWALDNCFDKEKVDTSLFKSLLPYIVTIKGAAVNRLLTEAKRIISESMSIEQGNSTVQQNSSTTKVMRAKKITLLIEV